MIFSGRLCATSSMSMPPSVETTKATRDGRAVDQRREIELAVDHRAFLDIEAVDLLAVRAGLVRDQRRAEQPRCASLLHVLDRLDDLRRRRPCRGRRHGSAPSPPTTGLPSSFAAASGLLDREGGDARAAPARRSRAAPPWPDTRGCSSRFPSRPRMGRRPASLLPWPRLGAIVMQASTSDLHGGDRFVEHRALGAVELDLDDALDALGADHRRHADIEILDAIFAVEMGGAGQHALLVRR